MIKSIIKSVVKDVGKSSIKAMGISWSSYWAQLSSELKEDALFWLSGEIIQDGSSYYYKDVSPNRRNFLITGLDWSDDSRVSGNFPFKTFATISAPAGDAALIAADINHFLYDSGGTPNQITAQMLFQNVDYENKLFCKHEEHTLDSLNREVRYSGVKDIVLYSAAKSGDNLTTCNTYFSVPTKLAAADCLWVSKTGNDTTGNGTEALPYLTVVKAISMCSAGALKTIYIKSGDYNEASAGYDYIRFMYTNKLIKFYGLGRTRLTSNNANYIFHFLDGGRFGLRRIQFYGSKTYPTYFQSITETYEMKYLDYICTDIASNNEIKACACNIYEKNRSRIAISDTYLYEEQFITDNIVLSTTSGAITYLTNRNSAIRKSNITYNKINVNNAAAIPIKTTGTYADIKYNVINIIASQYCINGVYYDSTKGILNVIGNTVNIADCSFFYFDNNAARHTSMSFLHNTVTHTNTAQSFHFTYNLISDILNIEHNSVTSPSTADVDLCALIPTSGVPCDISIKYNKVISESTTGSATINFSESGIANVFDGAEIMYNYIKGGIIEHNDLTLNLHGILARSGKNMTIAYNYVVNTAIGIVYKNEGIANTSGGIFGNVLINNRVGVYLRGCNEARVYNNVFYEDSTATNTNSYHVVADFQVAHNTNCYFENNIFVRLNSVVDVALFSIQAGSLAAGTKIKRNIVYCPDYTAGHWLYDGTNYYSLAQSITNGYAENINETNPEITASRPYPVPAIEGATDLGATFDDGLDVSSVWPEAVILRQQGASWQFGAFVQ